jgi:hypothetical protein
LSKFRIEKSSVKLGCFVIVVMLCMELFVTHAKAGTSSFDGVNWADGRDNYVNGWVIPSGLTASDTYSSAATVADKVIGGFQSNLGANAVRMPINEPSVSQSWWGVYTGAIDKALSKGMKVDLCYWAWHNGKPDDMTAFWTMWTTVTNKYKSNSNVYFEIMKEPYAYSATDWKNISAQWLSTYSNIPKGRVLVGGTGYCDNVANVASDSRFSGCLFSQHIYAYWDTSKVTEQSWRNDLSSRIGSSNTSNTIVTEYGAPMTTGKNYNGSINGDNEIAYMYGIPNQMRDWGMGNFFWPGLRDGDTYSMENRNGSGSGITLTNNNASGRIQLRWGWGF